MVPEESFGEDREDCRLALFVDPEDRCRKVRVNNSKCSLRERILFIRNVITVSRRLAACQFYSVKRDPFDRPPAAEMLDEGDVRQLHAASTPSSFAMKTCL